MASPRGPVTLAIVLLSSACRHDAPTSASPPTGSLVQPNMISNQVRWRTLDDELSELVNQIEGFGGFFYDDDGTLAVHLKNPETLPSSRSKVAGFMGRWARGRPARLAAIATDAARMRALPARFDYRELLAWYRREIIPNVGGAPEVTMTDIDERRNRIVIGVADPSLVGAIRDRVARLSVPRDAVEVIHFEHQYPQAGATRARPDGRSGATVQLLTDQLRPVPGGAQIQQLYNPPGGGPSLIDTCTLGFNLVGYIGGVLQPGRYFVTASHCAHPRSVVIPTSMAQPIGS